MTAEEFVEGVYDAFGVPHRTAPAQVLALVQELKAQIDELAAFIMAEVPGEPSRSEGAVDTAIRLLRAANRKCN